MDLNFGLFLNPVSTLFRRYFGGQIHWLRKPDYRNKTTYIIDKLNNIQMYELCLARDRNRTHKI
jgi:hypothetical protein